MIFLLALFLVTPALAEEFNPVYVSQNGVIWGQELGSRYTHGCVDQNQNPDITYCTERISLPEDSEANRACIALGARLPTKKEIESLMKEFESGEDGAGRVELTPKGLQDFYSALQTTNHNSFVSMTLPSEDSVNFSYIFNPEYRKIRSKRRMSNTSVPKLFNVRCVQNPEDTHSKPKNIDLRFSVKKSLRILNKLKDDSYFSSTKRETKEGLWFKKMSSNGKFDPNFSHDAFDSKAGLGRGHILRDGYTLDDGQVLFIAEKSWSGGGAFNHSFLYKFNSLGALDKKFGKKGEVSFKETVSHLPYRYVRNIEELENKKIIGIDYRCGVSRCETYIFRLQPNGSVDKRFGTKGFVKISGLQEYDKYTLLVTGNEVTIARFAGSVLSLGRLNISGEFDPNFGHEGWKRVGPLSDNYNTKCKLADWSFSSSKLSVVAICHKHNDEESTFIRLGKFTSSGDPIPGFAKVDGNWLDLPITAPHDKKLSGAGIIQLSNENTFVSYIFTSTTIHEDKTTVKGRVFSKNGELIHEGDFKFVFPDDIYTYFFQNAPKISLWEESSGKVLLSVYDKYGYHDNFLLKTKPLSSPEVH